jgi:hypothetical protein
MSESAITAGTIMVIPIGTGVTTTTAGVHTATGTIVTACGIIIEALALPNSSTERIAGLSASQLQSFRSQKALRNLWAMEARELADSPRDLLTFAIYGADDRFARTGQRVLMGPLMISLLAHRYLRKHDRVR